MAFAGQRQAVPSSRYCMELDVIEATGWTHEQYLAQPVDLVEEEHIRLIKRASAHKHEA